MNVAYGNVDPREAFWDRQPGGPNGPVLCELTVDNVDDFLTPPEQEASFGVNTGISFVFGNLFTYSTKCTGSDDDPDGCDDPDARYPLCTNATECNGAQYEAPVGDSNCRFEDSSADRISKRVVLTNPALANASESINVLVCIPAVAFPLGYVICLPPFFECEQGSPPTTAAFLNAGTFPEVRSRPEFFLPFAQGDTLAHEIGHLFGLLHPFETIGGPGPCVLGDCETTGDLICDTPPQIVLENSCAALSIQDTVIDSCGTNEPAFIRTFMGYVYDECMDVFTTDQVQRMQETIIEFLPSLCEKYAPGGNCVGRKCELGQWSQWSDCEVQSCIAQEGIIFGPTNIGPSPSRIDSRNQRQRVIDAGTVGIATTPQMSPMARRIGVPRSSVVEREKIAPPPQTGFVRRVGAVLRSAVAGLVGDTVSSGSSGRGNDNRRVPSPPIQPSGAISGTLSGDVSTSNTTRELGVKTRFDVIREENEGFGIETRERDVVVFPVGQLESDQCEGGIVEQRRCELQSFFQCQCPFDESIGQIILSLGACADRTSITVRGPDSNRILFRVARGAIPSDETSAVVTNCLRLGRAYTVEIRAQGCTTAAPGGGAANILPGCPENTSVGFQIIREDLDGLPVTLSTDCGSLESGRISYDDI